MYHFMLHNPETATWSTDAEYVRRKRRPMIVPYAHLSDSVVVERDGDAFTSINQGFSCASIRMSYPYLLESLRSTSQMLKCTMHMRKTRRESADMIE